MLKKIRAPIEIIAARGIDRAISTDYSTEAA